MVCNFFYTRVIFSKNINMYERVVYKFLIMKYGKLMATCKDNMLDLSIMSILLRNSREGSIHRIIGLKMRCTCITTKRCLTE